MGEANVFIEKKILPTTYVHTKERLNHHRHNYVVPSPNARV